jgi:hypothetical protein
MYRVTRSVLTAIAALCATIILLAISTTPAQADPSWNPRVKCSATGRDGRVVPTRFGNSELGWIHFSGEHNIKVCELVNFTIAGTSGKQVGNHLEYYGWVLGSAGFRRVQTVVVVQYTQRTTDRRYNAGPGQRIGVITAFCKNMNKCPNWVNNTKDDIYV